MIAKGTRELTYTQNHSLAGKKTKLIWPDGTAIDYGTTAHGQLDSVTIPGEGTMSLTDWQWLLPKKVTLPGGGTQNHVYDGLLNLESLQAKTPGQQNTLSLNHTYGRLLELATRNRTDTANNTSTSKSETFTYDDENRLTKVESDTGGLFGGDTETFTLDGVANRTAHNKTPGAWTYDANHRLTKIGSGTCGSTNTTCTTWNDAGNLTRQTAGSTPESVTNFTYDAQHRLTEVRNGNNQLIARYGYDPANRRLWKEQFREKSGQAKSPAKRTLYLYGEEGPLAEATQTISLNADETVSAVAPQATAQITTQYGPKPESPFTTGVLFIKTKNTNNDDVIAYFHRDHLGTPIQATDKAGNIVWAASYNAFGQASITTPAATAEKPTITSNLRLPGQYEDTETGLHYNWNRFYDPNTGRYVTEDPIGIKGGVNRYVYVDGKPVGYIDPTGEIVWAPIVAGVAGIAGGIANGINSANSGAGFWGGFGCGFATGALGGIMGAVGVGSFVSGGVVGGLTQACNRYFLGVKNHCSAWKDILIGAGAGSIGGAMGNWGGKAGVGFQQFKNIDEIAGAAGEGVGAIVGNNTVNYSNFFRNDIPGRDPNQDCECQ